MKIHKSFIVLSTVIGFAVMAVVLWIATRQHASSSEKAGIVISEEDAQSGERNADETNSGKKLPAANVLAEVEVETAHDHSLPADAKEDEMGMTQSEKEVFRAWSKREYSTESAVSIGTVCLKHRLSLNEVTELLGLPSHKVGTSMIGYNFAPSQLLELYFDEDGKILDVKITGVSIANG